MCSTKTHGEHKLRVGAGYFKVTSKLGQGADGRISQVKEMRAFQHQDTVNPPRQKDIKQLEVDKIQPFWEAVGRMRNGKSCG